MLGPLRPLLLVVVAGLVTTTLALPAAAADAVRLTAADTTPAVGQKVVLTANVQPRRAGRPVVFQRRDGGRWVQLGSDATNRRGVAAVTARFTEAGATTVRAVAKKYRGDPQRTDTLRLTVVKATTTVAADFPAGPWLLGQEVGVPVQVGPPRSGRRVWVERLDGTTWVRATDAVTTDSEGRVTPVWTPTRTGTVRLRVAVAASATHRPATSAAVAREVRDDGAEHLDVVAPQWVTVGSQFQVELAVGHDVDDLQDATLTVTVPTAGSHVVPPEELVLDTDSGTATATLGDQPAGPLRHVPLRWQAPAEPTELTLRAGLTATGVTEEVEATVEVVPEGGPVVLFGGGLEAMVESRDAPTRPDQIFAFCGFRPTTPVPDFATALAEAQAFLDEAVDPEYADDWEALAAQNDPALLDEVVLIALADQRPAAALAAALRAHELAPSDAVNLSNAAAAANLLERPAWAVAFARQAGLAGASGAVGVRQEAVRLVNLGHGHALMQQWSQAEAALRQAVAVDPQARSVRAELAKVLACAGNNAEALPHWRRSLRTDDTPDPITDPESSGSARQSRIDTSLLFDLSGGVDQEVTLPKVHDSLAALAGLARPIHGGNGYYDREHTAVMERLMSLYERRNDLEAQLRDRQAGWEPVRIRRTTDILNRIATNKDSAIIDAREAFDEDAEAVFGLNSCDGMFIDSPFCAVDGLDTSCALTEQVYAEWERRMVTYQDSFAAYHDVVARHFSGLQSLLSDPVAHELAGVEAELHMLSEVSYMTSNLWASADHLGRLNNSPDNPPEDDGPDPPCNEVAPMPLDEPVDVDRTAVSPCAEGSPASLLTLSLDLDVVTVSVDCESFVVEASSDVLPWLQAFAKYESPWGSNGASLNVGVRASAGGASFDSALYLEQDSGGKVTDFGWEVGPEVSAGGAISVSAYEDKVRISVMSLFVDP